MKTAPKKINDVRTQGARKILENCKNLLGFHVSTIYVFFDIGEEDKESNLFFEHHLRAMRFQIFFSDPLPY